MNEGWKCPECGKCYAPWVSECRNEMCSVVTGSGDANRPYPIFPTPLDEPATADPLNTWDGSDNNHACCACPVCVPIKYDLNASASGTQIDGFEPWY